MRKTYLMLLLSSITTFSFSQTLEKTVTSKEVERIEKALSSDEMQGRKVGTPGIDKAADFIAKEFKAIGLQTFDTLADYKQRFTLLRPKQISASVKFQDQEIDSKNIVIVTSQGDLRVNDKSGYEKAVIAPGGNFSVEVQKYMSANKNIVVLVDTSYSKNFPRLSALKRQIFKSDKNIIFILSSLNPADYTITAKHEFIEVPMSNVVGIIPGKTRKDELVVFSGHYDHLGIGQEVNGDSIFNGANDDAAGITAVIMLAKHFKAINDNERTLIFSAFTAEESGGYGSQYFSRQLSADKVAAMFNIEMIGTESKWGKNSAYITGYEVTDMGKIMEKNLVGTKFKFYPDPYTEQNLFYRSDNATLARLGVPAHTISTSKMDNEPNYHKVSDEISTLNINNMTEIIRAIAISSKTIVSGKDTPSRVNTNNLKR